MDEEFWDTRYAGSDQLFSGNPNGVLVTEVADLPPGQALDLGCGEGADASWLARRGWQVTAVDISRVALRRAAATAGDLDGRIAWTHADLTTTPVPASAFDLVSAQYLPLRRDSDHLAVLTMLAAVAPGGTLLVVGHDPSEVPPDVDASVYFHPADVARLLDDDWTVLVDELRPRTAPAPAGTSHTRDTVLRARRRDRATASTARESTTRKGLVQ